MQLIPFLSMMLCLVSVSAGIVFLFRGAKSLGRFALFAAVLAAQLPLSIALDINAHIPMWITLLAIHIGAFFFGKRAGLTLMTLTAVTAGAAIVVAYSAAFLAEHIHPGGAQAWINEITSQISSCCFGCRGCRPPISASTRLLSHQWQAAMGFLLFAHAVASPIAFAVIFMIIDGIGRPPGRTESPFQRFVCSMSKSRQFCVKLP